MSLATRLQALEPTDLGVDGPTPLDMARSFRSVRADPLSFLVEVRRRYGDLVAFPLPGPPALLVNHPADVRHVLQSSGRRWGKQTAQYAALARVTGPGLLATSEPSWIDHRRLAAPAFHHGRLEWIGDQVRTAVDASLAGWTGGLVPAGGAVLDVTPLLLRVALDAVGRALFSTDLSAQGRELLDASGAAARLVVRAGRSLVPTPAWVPLPLNLRLSATRARLDAASAEVVARRRAGASAPGAVRSGGPGHGDDLLGLLLDSTLTDEEIRDELVTMVIAGHETVASALAWTLMLLAEHPGAQERLREELTAHAGPVPMLGHRAALPWTRAVVDESLRLFPPAWALSRRALEPDVVGGHPVPAGTLVVISPWLLHRCGGSWSDPLSFRPERFVQGRVDRPGYLPFGLGSRLCIGREFALGEMVLVLSRLLSAYRVSLPPHWVRPRAEARVAIHPHGGMRLRLTPLARRPG